MRYPRLATWISWGAIALSVPGLAGAADAPQGKPIPPIEAQTKSHPATVATPVYRPPTRGVPGGRVGGGTRGTDQTFVLSVLAPNHVGLTTQEQPAMYWYLSKAISTPIEFTVIDDQSIKPILAITLSPPFQAGVHRIRLADHEIRLLPGRLYQWFVALVMDGDHRSRDILAGGTIERREPPDTLSAQLGKAGASAALLYAGAGFWYDALAAVSDQIDVGQSDPALWRQRASLLEQVGLTEIAEYDKRAADR